MKKLNVSYEGLPGQSLGPGLHLASGPLKKKSSIIHPTFISAWLMAWFCYMFVANSFSIWIFLRLCKCRLISFWSFGSRFHEFSTFYFWLRKSMHFFATFIFIRDISWSVSSLCAFIFMPWIYFLSSCIGEALFCMDGMTCYLGINLLVCDLTFLIYVYIYIYIYSCNYIFLHCYVERDVLPQKWIVFFVFTKRET